MPASRRHPALSPRSAARKRLQRRYDELWSAAIGRIRAGRVELDPVLQSRSPDERRGLTLLVRPSTAVRRRVAAFLGELGRFEPAQHYYAPCELHVTVLSLFTATIDFTPFFARKIDYLSAVDDALKTAAPLRIAFEGVTISPGTVMVQGFVEDSALNELRDTLRDRLRARGLGAGVDERYRLETAHMTVVRFRTPLSDGGRFAAALADARRRKFGATGVHRFSLVRNDWYMSRRVTRTLESYPAARAG